MRSNKDAIFKRDAFKNRNMVLDFYPRTNTYVRLYVDTLPYITGLAYGGMLPHMRLSPNACACTNACIGVYVGCRADVVRDISHMVTPLLSSHEMILSH